MRGVLTPFPSILAALGGSLLGQVLLLRELPVPGTVLYLASLALLAFSVVNGPGDEPGAAPGPSRRGTILLLMAVLAGAFALRAFRLGWIPWGLNNDEGIEGLIACRFLSGSRFTPFSDIGVARETLYHLLLLPIFRLFGSGILPLRSLSVLSGVAAVALAYAVGREFFSSPRVGLFAAGLVAASPWHLLYSRTGLRNILAPVFLLSVLWTFHRALESRRIPLFVLSGMALGIGMYSYTSFRVVPLLVGAWALLRRWCLRRRALTWMETIGLVAPFVTLLIPQILYAVRDFPGFVARGAYVLKQTPRASYPANLFYSLLMPVVYPERYGVVQTDYYFGDGVSLVYAAVGRTPETVLSAALMACGFALALMRLFRRRSEGEGVLLLFLLGSIASVGWAGPSLSRLLPNSALLCLMGALSLEQIFRVVRDRFHPAAAWAAVSLLLAIGWGLGIEQYFLRAGRSEAAMSQYAYPQTLMGLYAVSQKADHPVFVFATQQPEALQFLTYSRRHLTILSNRPESLDLNKVRSTLSRQQFVMENNGRFLPVFTALARMFPTADSSTLADARHFPDRVVAYVLDIEPSTLPASPGIPAGPGTPLPPP